MRKEKKFRFISKDLIIVLILIAAAVLTTGLLSSWLKRVIAWAVILVIAVLYFYIKMWHKQKMTYIATQLFKKSADKINKYMNAGSIPTVVTYKNGDIWWQNPYFVLLAGCQCKGKNIYKLFPNLDRPNKDRRIEIDGKSYLKEALNVEYAGKEYVIHRIIDTAHAYEATEVLRTVMPVVFQIQVDNLADVMRGMERTKHLEIETEIERILSTQA